MQMCPSCSADNSYRARYCVRCGTRLRGLLGFGTMLKGRYKVVRVLGCGGMGAVYLAFDSRMNDAPVAVKENLDQSPEAQQQFVSEAQILMKLRHPNLPRVKDYFVERNGRQYIIMDYIPGEDLQTLVQKNGPLAVNKALSIAEKIMAAVQYLHEQDPPVIHRDIKPSNIKLTPNGEPVLVDFGIAKVYRAGQKTQAGARAVSPGFSPIEQYGHGTTDQRSDIYALGATFYFMLTGVIPPEATERVAGATDKLIPVRSINPNVPPHIDKAIWIALRVRPDERFKSVREMKLAFENKLPLKVSPPRPATSQQHMPSHRQRISPPSAVKQQPTPQQHTPANQSSSTPNLPSPPQPYSPTVAEVPEKVLSVGEPASLILRSLAFVVDLVVLIPTLYIIAVGTWGLGQIVMSSLYGPDRWVVSDENLQRYIWIVVVGGFFLYRLISHWWWGQTMGKSLFKLYIVNESGMLPSFFRVLIREIVFVTLMFPCALINIASLLTTPSRQAFHDFIVNVFVVRCEEETTS